MGNGELVPVLLVGELYSATKQPADLLPKEIGIYTDDNVNATVGATITDTPYLRIVQGTSDNSPSKQVIDTREIKSVHVTSFTGRPYRAPQRQVVTAGNWVFDTSKDYQIIVEQILPFFDMPALRPRTAIVFKPLSTDTLASFLTSIALYLNTVEVGLGAERQYVVTATATTLVFTATTDYAAHTVSVFEFTGCYDCGDAAYVRLATITETTSWREGNGTCDTLLDMEERLKALLGFDNIRDYPVTSDVNYVECPKCYDVIVITHNNTYETGSTGGAAFIVKPLLVYIVSPIGSGVLNSLLAVLNPWMASTLRALAPVAPFV
jgi:hypothetical protein